MSWVWGVDTSTKAVDIVTYDTESMEGYGDFRQINAQTEVFAGAETCARAFHATCDLAASLTPEGQEPSLIVVESPFVRRGGQDLMMNYGSILAALGTICACPVVEIASATWKAHAPGHGHADKKAVADFAWHQGFHFDRQDQADAFCMARYGADLLRRRSQPRE